MRSILPQTHCPVVSGLACALACPPGRQGSPLPRRPATLPRGIQPRLLFPFSLSRLDRCQKFELLFQQSGQAGHYMGTCGQGGSEPRTP